MTVRLESFLVYESSVAEKVIKFALTFNVIFLFQNIPVPREPPPVLPPSSMRPSQYQDPDANVYDLDVSHNATESPRIPPTMRQQPPPLPLRVRPPIPSRSGAPPPLPTRPNQ